VTEDGPRFILEVEEAPEELHEDGSERRGPSGGDMAKEVKRQTLTELLTLGPMQVLQRAWVFISSGAILKPRNIIMIVMVGGSMMVASGFGLSSCRSKQKLVRVERSAEDCNRQVESLSNMREGGGISSLQYSDLAFMITGSTKLKVALEDDNILRAKVLSHAQQMLSYESDYSWIKDSDAQSTQRVAFRRWREAIRERQGLDVDTRRLLIWMAARRGSRNNEWISKPNSQGDYSCARGPLSLTYRQSVHLEIDAQPDVYTVNAMSNIDTNDKEAMADLILPSISGFDLSTEDAIERDYDKKRVGDGEVCVFQTGADQRIQINRMAGALEQALGANANALPPTTSNNSAITRIAKVFAADVRTHGDFRRQNPRIDFSATNRLSTALGDAPYAEYITNRTAGVIARAMMLPCLAVLNNTNDYIKELLDPNEQFKKPDELDCIVLDYKIRREGG